MTNNPQSLKALKLVLLAQNIEDEDKREEIRVYVNKALGQFDEWDLNNPDFQEALVNISSELEKRLLEYYSEADIETAIPSEMVEAVDNTLRAEKDINLKIKNRSEGLVSRWINELKEKGIKIDEHQEKAISDELKPKVSEGLRQAPSKENYQERLAQALSNPVHLLGRVGVAAAQKPAKDIKDAVSSATNVVVEGSQSDWVSENTAMPPKKLTQLYKKILTDSADISDPLEYTKMIVRSAEMEPDKDFDVLTEEVKMFAIKNEVMKADKPPEEFPAGTGFFQALAVGGSTIQKTAAPILDSQKNNKSVSGYVAAKSFERASRNDHLKKDLTKVVGSKKAEEHFAALALISQTYQKTAKPGAMTMVADFIFQNKADAAVNEFIKAQALASRQGPVLLDGAPAMFRPGASSQEKTIFVASIIQKFKVSVVYSRFQKKFETVIGMASFSVKSGKRVLGWVARKTVKKGAKKAAAKGVEFLGKAGLSKLLGGTIGTIIGGPIGTFVGTVVFPIITTVAGWGLKIISGGTKSMFNFLVGAASGGFGVKSSAKEDDKKAIIVIAVIMFIIIFITTGAGTGLAGTGFVNNMHSSRFISNIDDAPQPGPVGDGLVAQGAAHPAPPDYISYQHPPPPPECPPNDPSCRCIPDPNDPTSCMLPVSCGCVTQGPGGSYSHEFTGGYNSIDISDCSCASVPAVTATHKGTVIYAQLNTDGYGNAVIVQAEDGSQTLYGHLSYFAVSAGTEVQKGDTLGTMGSTGHSSGIHLHYEYRAGPGDEGYKSTRPGEIYKFWPTTMTAPEYGCSSFEDCGSITWNNQKP